MQFYHSTLSALTVHLLLRGTVLPSEERQLHVHRDHTSATQPPHPQSRQKMLSWFLLQPHLPNVTTTSPRPPSRTRPVLLGWRGSVNSSQMRRKGKWGGRVIDSFCLVLFALAVHCSRNIILLLNALCPYSSPPAKRPRRPLTSAHSPAGNVANQLVCLLSGVDKQPGNISLISDTGSTDFPGFSPHSVKQALPSFVRRSPRLLKKRLVISSDDTVSNWIMISSTNLIFILHSVMFYVISNLSWCCTPIRV